MSHYLDRFNEVKSQHDLDDFLSSVGRFHDGLIKEMHIVNSAYIDYNLSMSCNSNFDMRLLIQRQYNHPSAVEIILGTVLNININSESSGSMYGATGSYNFSKINGEIVIELKLDKSVFQCKKLYFRDASDWMGINNRLGDFLSLDTLQSYDVIEDGYVICNNCFEAWQPGTNNVVQCPRCSGMYGSLLKKG